MINRTASGVLVQGESGMDNKNVQDRNERLWHAMGRQDVLSYLGVDERGLDREEVRRRLEEYGPNLLPEEEKPGALRRFMRQFKNMLIYILLAAAALTAFLGEWVDMAVILGVVVINALIGFIQEGKAERAMEAIRGMLSPSATVVRDSERYDVPAEELVPGDIVMLRSGDRVPADLRIVYARNAQADEAALTGESEPVGKRTDPVEQDAPLGDRRCMAYSSTLITSGQLRGVVTATGARTEIGRISEMVSRVQEITTPLIRKINTFGHWLSIAMVLLSTVIFFLGYTLRGFSLTEMFMVVVSLVVAAIPEGLPAIMTITLALGVQRMARRNAIIRRLQAVETLGSVTDICSDKTGTLTRNEMTVTKVAVAGEVYAVSGVGYQPTGQFSLEGDEGNELVPQEHPWLVELARAGLLASEARLRRKDDRWIIEGMPTEGSVVVLARKAGLVREKEHKARPQLDVIPFESERRYMASLHKDPEGMNVLFVKGAPERVLEMCSRQRMAQGDEPIDHDGWVRREEQLADTGHRVLAIATRRMDGVDTLREGSIEDLTMLGLVAIIDPPREEAIAAIRHCREAGIGVKMITGDHVLTARSIGAAMGIGDGEHAVTGKELDQADEEEMVRLVEENDVFARSSPEHKLHIMEALQSRGRIVAMTGDGVNDAPALKRADVGVAMGIKGTEAAKEAAEIVLADDNFATIEQAVKEGRTIYDNLLKTILFILPTNGAEALVVISSVLILFEVMPITPLQILWVNMVTAVTLALALSFEPAEKGIMRRAPRPPHEPIISKYLFWRICFVSVLIATASILLFMYHHVPGTSLEEARTVAVNTLVAGQLFYLFNSRFIERSSLTIKRLKGNNKAFIAAGALVFIQLAFTYLGPLQTLFGTASISASAWVLIIAAGFTVFLLVEAEKALMRRWHGRPPHPRPKEAITPPPRLPAGVPTPFKSYRTMFEQEILQAVEELRRPAVSLLISGLIAGSGIGLSVLLLGILQTHAGADMHELLHLVLTANAYAAGFIIIIMARTDLFTEYTTVALLPLMTRQSSFSSVARLWAIIYAANLLGGAAFALLLANVGPALGIVHQDVYGTLALNLVQHPWHIILASAFLTGWLMGMLSWLLIAARESISQVFFIWLIAGIIGLANLHHAIVGAIEVLLGVIATDAVSLSQLGYFMGWTTLGNIAGGLLFAVFIRYSFLPHKSEREGKK
jgi:magnesium-transporting ATPase (P-type)/formate/nitrite transporter FocA (FNT family)